MTIDYLIVGSGLSALVFGALMANAGKKVTILEAHEHPGGFGHSFKIGNKYTFNAQLHYVWDCGEGETVNCVLKRLNLAEKVTFERYNPDGFDHMRMPSYSLDIPSDSQVLINKLSQLFPEKQHQIRQFILEVNTVSQGLKYLSPPLIPFELLKHFRGVTTTLKYLNQTLQDVFDQFNLPKAAQTLLALQWPDFLLPPEQLSFYAWVILFTGYQRGAYYPTKHFEFVINSLVQVIEEKQGKVLLNQEVTEFIVKGKTVTGVKAIDHLTQQINQFSGETVICNIDPQKAAKIIGIEKFSAKVRRQLNYQYSPSNYVAYCVVKDLDLRDYGFGKWNTFHTEHPDLNKAFSQMYEEHNFSQLSFAITTPTLITDAIRDCPEDCQIIQFLTVANYDYFRKLKDNNKKAYKQKKEEILNIIIDIVEKHYIPNFREHIVLKITGSPTTNERFCWCPQGNSYGSNMTPKQMTLGRLTHESSLNNFYFCNASSGYPGFAATFWTGAILYQHLSKDLILSKSLNSNNLI
ncbi:MAG TPA: NAD(P)/FAD-dependent oxidoreductase [Cyanothece sp. UBA12306]|nr:NAD(P)/FAD-dependent oxidoreductase [Cyanothece sp. UBA12306]